MIESKRDRTKYELADLFGKRLVCTIEAGAARHLDEVVDQAALRRRPQ